MMLAVEKKFGHKWPLAAMAKKFKRDSTYHLLATESLSIRSQAKIFSGEPCSSSFYIAPRRVPGQLLKRCGLPGSRDGNEPCRVNRLTSSRRVDRLEFKFLETSLLLYGKTSTT
eukprot:scaffold240312_cov46-Prasinocladus_malaysianus.AAC.1